MRTRTLLPKKSHQLTRESKKTSLTNLTKKEIELINSKESLKIALRDYYLHVSDAIEDRKNILADTERVARATKAWIAKTNEKIEQLQDDICFIKTFLNILESDDAN